MDDDREVRMIEDGAMMAYVDRLELSIRQRLLEGGFVGCSR